ncbi:beta-phosphoglucomutase [Iocasia frigidifontis]|uniref:Beta-phosphoglucomutase n=1 Tax=Iocasia fonsfrigidae TaxID=2682810 RepID=A0A8A7KHX8_9FIRM|nr:beta-phosphoglucomutase [Iocasia fonsfrigidae]QTL99388.1 beta-phosphoglucomutase [Iocasia fonsfrigidae]
MSKRNKGEIKAVIFDLDGVLTDTAEYHYQSWKKLAQEEGISFTREDNEQLRGVTRRQSLEILLKGKTLPEDKMEELMVKKNEYYQELINNITMEDLIPGVEELLNQLQEDGYKLAVASASRNARTVIENLEIGKKFQLIADGYSVKNNKPAPDLFLYAAEELEVEPEECIVIEDAESGIEAALAAGMHTVGIGPEERVGQADFRYDKIKDIKLADIVQ